MSEQTEAVESTAMVFDKMEQYFDAAKQVIEQYGGDVADLALMALRIEAISELLPWVLFLSFIIFLGKKTHLFLAGYSKEHERDSDGASFLPLLGFWILSIILTGISLIAILDVWAWAGIFYPEIYAVHKFIL